MPLILRRRCARLEREARYPKSATRQRALTAGQTKRVVQLRYLGIANRFRRALILRAGPMKHGVSSLLRSARFLCGKPAWKGGARGPCPAIAVPAQNRQKRLVAGG